jgi:hypothetical protein
VEAAESQARIWIEISEALAWGMKDRTPMHRLNRLAREQFPQLQTWLDQGTCIAWEQDLSRHQVEDLSPWHQRTNAAKAGGKIIVFSHEGKSAIIDGNNRVAQYLKERTESPMPAILIRLREPIDESTSDA